MINRRQFLQQSAALASLAAIGTGCNTPKKISGSIRGASANIGHLLRTKKFGKPVTTTEAAVVIVGAGVSGLSAAYHLRKAEVSDFVVLDLEDAIGGNSVSGQNAVSAFPWGAHYIPIPNNHLKEYLNFLGEAGVVTGYDGEGLPVYNDYFLCFDPEERLYINGQWQDGLVPAFGVSAQERKQIDNFLKRMNEFRYATGIDGRDAFALPVNASSTDASFQALDGLTMIEWMNSEGFTSEHLHTYVNYCTRDDFGTPHNKTSAWAGIHYFACRKGRGANATHSDVLTWPEGNGFLVKQLSNDFLPAIRTSSLVTAIELAGEEVMVTYFDVKDSLVKAIRTSQCILAVPQFVAAKLLNDEARSELVHNHFSYVPWMVANLTVTGLEERNGAPLSWDNVLHGSASLGYVEATHQSIAQGRLRRNLTYYLPLTEGDPASARKAAQTKSHADWVDLITGDLQRVHPNIRSAIETLDVQLWGHAMVQPVPGLIHGPVRRQLATSLHQRIHFAHTDLAGVSLFEEGFYQGLAAAKTVRQNLTA